MILASHSPRRLELLQNLGADPVIISTNIDEHTRAGEKPTTYVQRMAKTKAYSALAHVDLKTDETLIAADTIVWMDDDHIFGKPKNSNEAKRMIAMLQGNIHFVSTGVCIYVYTKNHLQHTAFVETTNVEFYRLSENEITSYVKRTQPFDFAGGYAIQDVGALLVKSIQGDYANVVGLPLARLLREMAKLVGISETLVKLDKLLR